MKPRILLAQLVLGLFLLTASSAWAQFEKKRWPAGVPTPAVSAMDLNGRVWTSSDFVGKVVVLNFWATWCPPCIDELPMIEAFWREHTANGHQVVALAIDQPSAVRRFLDRQPLGFPIGMAGLAGTELAKSLGNAAGGLPFTVFFKADGSIWRQKMGQLTPDDLSQWRSATL